jgi:DNA-binding NarL/FixJ family response regulator
MLTYRVLIVDDHPLARQAVRSVLQTDRSFEIVGETGDGASAVKLCATLQPDLVLMDIHMPGTGGLEATRQIKQLYPHIRVVMLTVSDNVADLFTAVQFGAQGYLLKNMDSDDWLAYLRGLFDDDAEVSRRMADRLFHRFRSDFPPEEPPAHVLTPREREIVVCVSTGDNNRQIAEKLGITENTVKNHIKNILDKLSLENRVQLTSYAVRHGLTQIGHKQGDK